MTATSGSCGAGYIALDSSTECPRNSTAVFTNLPAAAVITLAVVVPLVGFALLSFILIMCCRFGYYLRFRRSIIWIIPMPVAAPMPMQQQQQQQQQQSSNATNGPITISLTQNTVVDGKKKKKQAESSDDDEEAEKPKSPPSYDSV